jgi:hypothetical protein
MSRHRIAAALRVAGLLSCAVAAVACFGDRREARAPGAAVWVGGGSEAPTPQLLERLAAQGATDYFVEAARLEWSGGRPNLRSVSAPRLARRERTTLVVTGSWPAGDVDAGAAGAELARGIRGLVIAAEGAGRAPVGVHFDLDVTGAPESYAKLLEAVREELDGRLDLSVSFGATQLADAEAAKRLAEPLDFLVAFLYGQRPGAVEDARAWDLQTVEGDVRRLEALERPYYLAAVTVGSAGWRDRRGRVNATSSSLDLSVLVRETRFELKRGFSLEGIDRQVYEFRAKSPVEVGDWKLAAGDSVRVVRAATSNVEEFLRRCGAWGAERLLGPLFWRLPEPGERLALTAANLADALAPNPSLPQLELVVERDADAVRDWRLRLTLVNHNDEASDLAFFDANWVELAVSGARIADVQPGQFARFELYHQGERATMRALREADAVRFWAPIVEGRQRMMSGALQLVRIGRAPPAIRTSGRFILTDGTMLEIPAREWTFEGAR